MPFCICMRVAGIVGTATGSTGLSVTPVFLLLLSKGTAFSTPSGVLGWFRRIETDALFDAPCVVYGKEVLWFGQGVPASRVTDDSVVFADDPS
uniref:Putative secreted protein n=1 Tax=Ixodes scapularis TaxID=6945 RepID=A0A4D5RER8_IXOSC